MLLKLCLFSDNDESNQKFLSLGVNMIKSVGLTQRCYKSRVIFSHLIRNQTELESPYTEDRIVPGLVSLPVSD